jgi:hypothetical protein
VKRTRWAILAGILLAAAAAGALFRPRPTERYPLAELVPADALFYAGFADPRELEALSAPWSEELKKRLEPARAHLSGGLAVYIDRAHQWVTLVRLTRAAALLAGAEVEHGAAVLAQTPEAMARHKAREGALVDLPEFRSLGTHYFVNLERLKPRGRLRDFSAAGFDVVSTSPLTLRGRALYRGGLFRTYLEQYVHAPRHGGPAGAAPVQVALTEHFPRVWEEIVHDLDTIDMEKVEREAQFISRDFLEGRPLREFLTRLGPTWGCSLVPAPQGKPALIVWIDLPDEGTRDLAAKMVHKAIGDAIRVRRERGLPPVFEIAAEGPIWRVKLTSARALRYGEAFTPAYTFEKNRFVFSTCVALLEAPGVAAGEAHLAGGIEIAPLLDLLRALAPQQADDAFRAEAERKAAVMSLRLFTPGTMVALKKQFPDPADLTKYQDAQKAQFEAKALEEISKTLPWQEELTRAKAEVEVWADRLSWLERASVSGRFTGEGFDFEVQAWPRRTQK